MPTNPVEPVTRIFMIRFLSLAQAISSPGFRWQAAPPQVTIFPCLTSYPVFASKFSSSAAFANSPASPKKPWKFREGATLADLFDRYAGRFPQSGWISRFAGGLPQPGICLLGHAARRRMMRSRFFRPSAEAEARPMPTHRHENDLFELLRLAH